MSQEHLTNISLSRAVQQLRQELVVLKQQLVAEKETSRALRAGHAKLEQAHKSLLATRQEIGAPALSTTESSQSRRDDLRSRWVDGAGQGGAASHQPAFEDDLPQLGSVFRASQSMPIRYVPPVDFLPPLFVEQYADVLVIVDRYAQLYHRYHVGGGQKDPSLILDEPEAARSTQALLEARVKALESDVAAKEDTIVSLKEQLIAWRATGHERSRFDNKRPSPPRWGGDGSKHGAPDWHERDDDTTSVEGDGASRRHRRASPRHDDRRTARPGRGDELRRPSAPRQQHGTAAPPLSTDANAQRAPAPTVGSSSPMAAADHQIPSSPVVTARDAAMPIQHPRPLVGPDLMALYAPPRSLFSEASLPPAPQRGMPSPSAATPEPAWGDPLALRHPWDNLAAA